VSEARDRAHFNRWSSTYEQSWMQKYLARVHEVMLGEVAPDQPVNHIVDVGCGTGRLLRRAAVRWPAAVLVGVDPAESMIDVARRLTPQATFEVAQAAKLPLAAEGADVVFSSVSMHHWPDPAAGLREAARVLQPSGRLVLADVAVPRWLGWLWRSGKGTKADLMRLVVGAGLMVVRLQPLLGGVVLVITADKVRAAA